MCTSRDNSWVGLAALLALACDGGEHSAGAGRMPEPAPAPAPVTVDPASVASALRNIAAASYRPLFGGEGQPPVAVAAFAIEEHAVTNAQFLAFVGAVPRWRRSRVPPLFADTGYLAHWASDLDLGAATPDSPVTRVSWFAARAYADWVGRRLPTTAEWETVAAASADAVDGRSDPKFNAAILEWYSKPARAPGPVRSTLANVHGVYDLHGLIWEWLSDFNNALVTGESRGDTALERNLFCGSGALGAADPSDYAAFMRFAFRSSLRASYVGGGLGFRCASDAGGERP